MFEGDNRGFSLKPNGTGSITSRIWHTLTVDTQSSEYLKITKSDTSKAPWADKHKVYSEKLAPRDAIYEFKKLRLSSSITGFSIIGAYWGVNHAMPLSPEMQEKRAMIASGV